MLQSDAPLELYMTGNDFDVVEAEEEDEEVRKPNLNKLACAFTILELLVRRQGRVSLITTL